MEIANSAGSRCELQLSYKSEHRFRKLEPSQQHGLYNTLKIE